MFQIKNHFISWLTISLLLILPFVDDVDDDDDDDGDDDGDESNDVDVVEPSAAKNKVF